MTRILFGIGLLLLGVSAATATPQHAWSKRIGSDGSDVGWTVAIDQVGNVIATGIFEGTVNLGGGDLTSVGGTDFFLAKFDADGGHLWSRSFGGVGYDEAWGIAADAAGNLIVAGYFDGTANFGGGDLTSNGAVDVFVARYDAAGAHLWSRNLGGLDDDYCWSVAVDGSGDAILTGYFRETVDFGGGPLVAGGESDIFVLKLAAAAGGYLWSHAFGSTDWDEGYSVATDSADNVIVTGYFTGSVDFGGGALTDPGGGDVFLARFGPNGAHHWSQRFGNASYDRGIKVAVDQADRISLIGYFWETIDFGGGELTSAGEADAFVARFDNTGTHLWSRRDGGADYDLGWAIAVDPAGQVYTSGAFWGTTNLGGGDLISAGLNDAYVAFYDADGAHVWSQRFGDTGNDESYGIAADVSGGPGTVVPVTAVGLFNGTVDFGGGAVTSVGLDDAFLVQFRDPTALAAPGLPTPSALAQNHPNPFNPQTTIAYTVASPKAVTIEILDVSGRLVARLDQGLREAGTHRVQWSANDLTGKPVPSGVYFYRFAGDDRSQARKMVLIR